MDDVKKKVDWVNEVVGEWVTAEKIVAEQPKEEVNAVTTEAKVAETVEEKADPKVVQKKTKKIVSSGVIVEKSRTVKLFLDNVLWEYDINEKLPFGFLQTKLKEGQFYMPVGLYRDIMRQIGEFGIPDFSDIEKITSGKNKSQVDMVTYKMTCKVARHKPWSLEPIMLKWFGYSSMSAGVLLSDAVHGNMHTLASKALRDAMKYAYNIFEYPEVDVIDAQEPWTINEKKVDVAKAQDTIKKVAEDMKDVETDPSMTPFPWGADKDISTNEAIENDYKRMKEEMFAQLETAWELVTKQSILALAGTLKRKYGEEHKDFISKVIVTDFNSAK